MLNKMKVMDLMTEKPLSVSPRDDVGLALDYMDEYKIRHLPVIDSDGELLGIISQRDLLMTPIVGESEEFDEDSDAYEIELRETKVDEVYTRTPETIDEDESLIIAAQTLLENKIGCLPVTKGSQLVGILTEADFVRLVLSELDEEGKPILSKKTVAGSRSSHGNQARE